MPIWRWVGRSGKQVFSGRRHQKVMVAVLQHGQCHSDSPRLSSLTVPAKVAHVYSLLYFFLDHQLKGHHCVSWSNEDQESTRWTRSRWRDRCSDHLGRSSMHSHACLCPNLPCRSEKTVEAPIPHCHLPYCSPYWRVPTHFSRISSHKLSPSAPATHQETAPLPAESLIDNAIAIPGLSRVMPSRLVCQARAAMVDYYLLTTE